MNPQILNAVLADFDRRRQQHGAEEDRRQAEIAQKHPDLAALIQQRHSMVMGSVRSAFTNADPRNAEKQMAEFNQRIGEGLEKYGYPKNYLAPIVDCRQCGDTGYYYDHSLQKPCDCLKKAYLAALSREEAAGEAGPTFARFDPLRFPDTPLPGTDVTQREYMRVVRKKCLDFAVALPDGEQNTLLLHGGSGLGKTFLLHCIENHAREKDLDVLYVTAYDLLMALKTAYYAWNGDKAEEYFDVSLLLIDDLGMEPLLENVTVEQIFNLINARQNKGLATAISTNLSRTELQKRYTERVTSRLLDTRMSQAISFHGKDIRLMKG